MSVTDEGLPRKDSDHMTNPVPSFGTIMAAKTSPDDVICSLIYTAKRRPADALDWPSGNYKLSSYELHESLGS